MPVCDTTQYGTRTLNDFGVCFAKLIINDDDDYRSWLGFKVVNLGQCNPLIS